MNEPQVIEPRDISSVGTRVSWAAIAAGSLLALAICFLLTTLGTAVGISVHDQVSTTTIQTASVAWAVLIICTSLFVGGMAASLLTVGENKTEAVLHGILTWALVVALFFVLGAIGVRNGFNVTGQPTHSINTTGQVTLNDEMTRRFTWYSFAGTWLSMLAAAGGAYLGAGPTFRVIAIPRTRVVSSVKS